MKKPKLVFAALVLFISVPFLAQANDHGGEPIYATSGDLDGDGKPELLVCLSQTSRVAVLKGMGNGRFERQGPLLCKSSPERVEVRDLDGDKDLDVVVFEDQAAEIFTNTKGQLARSRSLDFAGLRSSCALLDMNGDGQLDWISVEMAGRGISIQNLEGKVQYEYRCPAQVSSACYGDFDGNGLMDAACAISGSKKLLVLSQQAKGNFSPIKVALPNPVGYLCNGRQSAGAPKDQILAVGGGWLTQIIWAGGSYSSKEFSSGIQANCQFAESGDFDGDGKPEAVFCDPFGPSEFFWTVGKTSKLSSIGSWHASCADWNGDGKLDLLFAQPRQSTVVLRPGRGNGSFGPDVTVNLDPNKP